MSSHEEMAEVGKRVVDRPLVNRGMELRYGQSEVGKS